MILRLTLPISFYEKHSFKVIKYGYFGLAMLGVALVGSLNIARQDK
jgi:hypothetical protein